MVGNLVEVVVVVDNLEVDTLVEDIVEADNRKVVADNHMEVAVVDNLVAVVDIHNQVVVDNHMVVVEEVVVAQAELVDHTQIQVHLVVVAVVGVVVVAVVVLLHAAKDEQKPQTVSVIFEKEIFDTNPWCFTHCTFLILWTIFKSTFFTIPFCIRWWSTWWWWLRWFLRRLFKNK